MKRILNIVLLLVFLWTPIAVSAQTKPKRDTSKDQSVIVAKQQAEAKKHAAQAAENKRKRAVAEAQRRRKAQALQTPKAATYLKVNQLTALSKNVESGYGTETFNVNTDGKEWSVLYVPSWCKVAKFSSYFILSYNANPSYDDRFDRFMVKCDNQEVWIGIEQKGAPFNIHSQFNSASLNHNILVNTDGLPVSKNLRVDANVTIQGAKMQKCYVVAYFKDENGNSIRPSYNYADCTFLTSEALCVSTYIVPLTDEAQNYNVSLLIPNNAMRLYKKKNKLRCYLAVYCVKTGSYVARANYALPFIAKNKKGNVTTKSM